MDTSQRERLSKIITENQLQQVVKEELGTTFFINFEEWILKAIHDYEYRHKFVLTEKAHNEIFDNIVDNFNVKVVYGE